MAELTSACAIYWCFTNPAKGCQLLKNLVSPEGETGSDLPKQGWSRSGGVENSKQLKARA
jgi:hypothetical protein